MSFQIEQVSRDLAPQRIVPGAERTVIVVRPGDAFRFVDDTGAKPAAGAPRVRRVGNNLVIDELPDDKVVELQNFFGACRPGAECTVALEGLGAPAGTVITEESLPTAALSDGSFLLYSTDPSAVAALPPATVDAAASEGGLSGGMIGAIGGGVLLVGAAAGGGGGGGGSSGGGGGTDTVPPPAPVITSAPILKASAPLLTGETEAGARVTVRLDLNGNGLFTDTADLTYVTTAGSDGRWSIDLSGTPQFGIPPAGGFAEGQSYGVLVQASDAAGNASATPTRVSFDGTPPRAPVIDVIAGDDVVNAAEREQGLTISGTAEAGSTVTVSLGDARATATASAAGAWSAAFAPGVLPTAGLFAVTARATDAAGNEGPASAPRQLVFETNVPGAPVITDDTAGTATTAVTFTITFDKPVTGITIDDILVEGGVKGAFTQVDPSVYRLVVTPFPDVQSGQIVLQIPAGAGTDQAGNPTTAASPVIQAYDTLRPSLVVTENAPTVTNQPVTFTFEFSEAVTGFDANGVSVSGGTKGEFLGSGTTYSLVVIPTPGAAGNIVVDVVAGVAVDAVGLGNTALAAPVVVPFDTAAPTLAITDNVTGTASGAITYTFTFSEPVTGFELADVVVTGVPPEAIGALSGSGAEYTLVVTPPADTSGEIGVSVAAGAAVDAVGNPSGAAAATAQAFNTDASLPTLTITDQTEAAVANGPVTFVLTFSEPVQQFGVGDVVVTGGTPGTLTQVSQTQYTLVVTPPGNTTGSLAVSVNAGAFTDVNGNANPAGASATQAFDTQRPTVQITDNVPAGTTNGPVTFTLQFSEPVIGFEIDVTTTAGGPPALGDVTTVDADTFTLVVAPPADNVGVITVSVPAGTASDAAGNTTLTTASVSQNFDTLAPTLTIGNSAGGGTATGPVTFTFTFSEAPAASGAGAFTLADVNVTGGSPGTLTGSGTSYSLVVTPPDGSGTVAVAVAAGAVTDAAGNAVAAASSSASYTIDSSPPTLTITDNVDAATTNGPITFIFTTSEPVVGFTAIDVAVTGGGTVTTGFAATGATTYSMTVTPPADATGAIGVSVAAGRFTDGAGNANTSGASTSQSYDTAAPVRTVTASDLLSDAPGSEGSVAPGASTDDSTPRFTFTIGQALSAGDTITLARNGTTVTTFSSGSDFSYPQTDPLPLGSYEYTATIADALGNSRALDLIPSADGLGYAFEVVLPPV